MFTINMGRCKNVSGLCGKITGLHGKRAAGCGFGQQPGKLPVYDRILEILRKRLLYINCPK